MQTGKIINRSNKLIEDCNWCFVLFYLKLCLLEESTANTSTSKESISDQKVHRKILDKGVPPDVMPGIKGVKVNLNK